MTRAASGKRNTRRGGIATAVATCALLLVTGADAQTIRGTLMDRDTDRPIPLGLVMMYTEAGDSVTATLTDANGRFDVTSPRAGSFILLASALGYEEVPAGVFELGPDGAMDVEYRLPPRPFALEEMVVSLNRPILDHKLVRNGFVRRAQRGLGRFVTPAEIEESSATTTEQLMSSMAGVRVGTVAIDRDTATVTRADIGETVQILGESGRWCTPAVFVDGVRTQYGADTNMDAVVTMSTLVSRESIDAIEVYRRPAEVPVEYATTTSEICGAIVLWTKLGAAPGSATLMAREEAAYAAPAASPVVGPPPTEGETVRVVMTPAGSADTGLASPWGGMFIGIQDERLLGTDTLSQRTISLPLEEIEEVHVLRPRPESYAWRRGILAAALVGGGVWGGLSVLCSWSSCNSAAINPGIAGAVTGLAAGFMVYRQGPGTHWVQGERPWADDPAARDPEGR